MRGFYCCLVLGLISILFQPRAEALVTKVEMNRVLMAYNAAFDICKEITDSSRHDSKTAADDACDQAFKALDRVKLNTCHGWRNAGCRLAHRGDQHRQCTCLISDCDGYSVRSHVITSFRDCAPELWTQELATGEVPAPTTNFKKRRMYYDYVLQAAASRRASAYSGGFNGGHGGSSSVYTTDGAGTLGGYGIPSTTCLSYAPGSSSAQVSKPYVCNECGCRLRSARGLYNHKNIYHSGGDTHCYSCNLDFNNMGGFEAHLRKRHPEMSAETIGKDPGQAGIEALLPFSCKFCGRRYSTSKGLGDHLVSHTTDETKCRVCHKVFSTRTSLKGHMESVHPEVPLNEPGVEVERFACRTCGKTYNSRKGLHDHEQSHLTMDTYCTSCKRFFSTKTNYNTHLKKKHPKVAAIEAAAAHQKYLEENPEECAICKARFRNERGLKDHMDSHFGKTTCTDCDIIFPRKSLLNLHKRKEHP